MGRPAYLFSDYISSLAAGAISITNEDSNYPEANLQSEQIAKTTRTTNKTSIKFRYDLGSEKALCAFFVGNHNFSGGTFDIKSYTASDYTTGPLTIETKTVRALDTYHYEEASSTVTGTNLITNGGFDSVTTGWDAVDSAKLTIDAGGQSGNCLIHLLKSSLP